MFTLIRYLALFAVIGFALNSDIDVDTANGLMQKDMVVAMLIALLTLPNVLRWSN